MNMRRKTPRSRRRFWVRLVTLRRLEFFIFIARYLKEALETALSERLRAFLVGRQRLFTEEGVIEACTAKPALAGRLRISGHDCVLTLCLPYHRAPRPAGVGLYLRGIGAGLGRTQANRSWFSAMMPFQGWSFWGPVFRGLRPRLSYDALLRLGRSQSQTPFPTG